MHPVECFSAGWEIVRPQYWLMVAVALVGILIGGAAPMGILLGPMMCGVYLCLLARMRGERIEFGLLFKGFDYFVPSLVATLVQLVPLMVILIPAYVIFFVSFVLAGAASASRGAPSGPAIGTVVAVAFVVALLIMAVSLAVGLFFAGLGEIFARLDCEPAPFMLAFLLGPMMEENLRRALLLSGGEPSVLVTRPMSLVLLLCAAGLLLLVLFPAAKATIRRATE